MSQSCLNSTFPAHTVSFNPQILFCHPVRDRIKLSLTHKIHLLKSGCGNPAAVSGCGNPCSRVRVWKPLHPCQGVETLAAVSGCGNPCTRVRVWKPLQPCQGVETLCVSWRFESDIRRFHRFWRLRFLPREYTTSRTKVPHNVLAECTYSPPFITRVWNTKQRKTLCE